VGRGANRRGRPSELNFTPEILERVTEIRPIIAKGVVKQGISMGVPKKLR
jgi:hypothetical protein